MTDRIVPRPDRPYPLWWHCDVTRIKSDEQTCFGDWSTPHAACGWVSKDRKAERLLRRIHREVK